MSKGKRQADTEITISFVTGGSTYQFKFEPNEILNSDETLIDLVLQQFKIKSYGLFESSPALSKTKLISINELEFDGQIKIMISQKVLDHLSTLDKSIPTLCSTYWIDSPLKEINFEIDIGLPPPLSPSFDSNHEFTKLVEENTQLKLTNRQLSEQITKHKRNASQTGINNSNSSQELEESQKRINELELQLKNKTGELEDQTEVIVKLESELQTYDSNSKTFYLPTQQTDVAIHTLVFHCINANSKGWSTIQTSQMLEQWRKKIKDLKVQKFDLTSIWNEVKETASTDRFGLAKAIFHCHDTEEQRQIINEDEHSCSILEQCPFNHIANINDSDLNLPKAMKGYLQYLIATETTQSGFETKSSKYGLSLLRSCWPLSESADFQAIFEMISHLDPDEFPDRLSIKRPVPNGKQSPPHK